LNLLKKVAGGTINDFDALPGLFFEAAADVLHGKLQVGRSGNRNLLSKRQKRQIGNYKNRNETG
jgi:hypothetical protein